MIEAITYQTALSLMMSQAEIDMIFLVR